MFGHDDSCMSSVDLDCMFQQQHLDEIVSPQGCPIAVLPLLNLALVCRCLDSADLLAVSACSRLMHAAAVHPLTFQHGNRFTVDPWCEGVRTEGPSAVISSAYRLRAALMTRRFASFRLLTLYDRSGNASQSLLQLLCAAPAGSAPALHALSLRWEAPDIDLSRVWSASARLSCCAALAYLKVLCVACPALSPFAEEGAALPPRIELLQLQTKGTSLADPRGPVLLPAGLASLLAPLTHLRQLVVRDVTFNLALASGRSAMDGARSSAVPLQTRWPDLMTLAAIEAAAPQIDSIVWMIEVDYNAIASAMGEFSKQHPDAPWPVLSRVRTLQIKRVAVIGETELAPNPLLCFPALTELRYTHRAAAGRGQALLLTQLCALQFSTLTALTLTEAGSPPLDRSRGWIVPHGLDLAPLLCTLPQLTSLGVSRLRIDSLSAFRFAPRLRTLHDLFWPVPAELVKADEMAACFPALTELSVRAMGRIGLNGSNHLSGWHYSTLHAFVLRPVLLAMPCLQRVSVNAAPMGSPDAILSPEEEAAIKQQQLQAHLKTKDYFTTQKMEDRLEEEERSAARSAQRWRERLTSDLEPAGQLSGLFAAAATTDGSAGSTNAEVAGNSDADPAADLLWSFVAGAGGISAGSATGAAVAPASVFHFAPPPSVTAPAQSAPAFSFGPAASSASNPFSSPFSFAPAAPGGPAFAAGAVAGAESSPLSFAPWTSAAAAPPTAAPAFSFAPPAATLSSGLPTAASASPSLAAPAPAFAFSAVPSTFAVAAPSAVANPFSTPFVFNAAPASPFVAAAPVGLPDLAGFNPFAASASSSSASIASAGSNNSSTV